LHGNVGKLIANSPCNLKLKYGGTSGDGNSEKAAPKGRDLRRGGSPLPSYEGMWAPPPKIF